MPIVIDLSSGSCGRLVDYMSPELSTIGNPRPTTPTASSGNCNSTAATFFYTAYMTCHNLCWKHKPQQYAWKWDVGFSIVSQFEFAQAPTLRGFWCLHPHNHSNVNAIRRSMCNDIVLIFYGCGCIMAAAANLNIRFERCIESACYRLLRAGWRASPIISVTIRELTRCRLGPPHSPV